MKTDDHAAILTGTVAWVVAAIVAWIFAPELRASGFGWVVAATIVGIVLGVIGLVYTFVSRRRGRSADRIVVAPGDERR
ncbi:DUF2530 domain-containing protein [Planctomonas sp. JC2975]|uniref:DUF2530 domain-containing protein n=1 Tax=Planctomonas sp. JC2975 TaxID=2729626 RepID=UPI001F110EEF|nr:DUF2530 domain-containing protein [Planctomonas sp. JC2975]